MSKTKRHMDDMKTLGMQMDNESFLKLSKMKQSLKTKEETKARRKRKKLSRKVVRT